MTVSTSWIPTDSYSKGFTVTYPKKSIMYKVEDFFVIPRQYNNLLETHNLVAHLSTISGFLLRTCELLDELENTDDEGFEKVKGMLSHALIYHNSRWYHEMTCSHLNEIPYRLWVMFNFCGDWYSCTGPSFRDMPTEILGKFFSDPEVRSSRFRTVTVEQAGKYLRQRDDVYALSDAHIRDLLFT